jgi:multidrug efflux system outer membrane protein
MKINTFFHATTQRRNEKQSKEKKCITIQSFSVAPLLCASSLLLILSGCTMAPEYVRPDQPVPASWPSGSAYTTEAGKSDQKPLADILWRDYFVEPRLQKVIELALTHNRDLRVAVLTIEKTRALYQIQRADLMPQIDGSAGAAIQRVPADLSSSGQARISRQYNVGLGISSYELDLFGRVRSLKDQALEQYLATEQTRRAVQISLVAEVAHAWLNLAADSERLKLARETLTSQQESYQLIQRRFEAGASSQLELRQAQTRVEAARVDSAIYTARLAQAENALNLLAGKPLPSHLLPTGFGSMTVVQELPVGLSSDVLLARPDIRAAEHRLKGANATIGVARAAFFPRIGLSASFGTASATLTDLFQSGSTAWNFVPQISVPLFAAGSNLANLTVSKAERDIAVAQYEKAIQTAFREVADTLASHGTLGDQLKAQQALADASADSFRLSEARYTRGVDSYLAVLDSQRSTYSAQQGLISVRLARLGNQVTLYKVLGGGSGD